MELKDFIRATLVDIKNSVSEANAAIGGDTTYWIHPSAGNAHHVISFDVAVTVSKEVAGGGGKLEVHIFSVNGGIEQKTVQAAVSRMRFDVLLQHSIS